MTAIAYRDGILAADSVAWGGDNRIIACERKKITRLKDGSLFAAAGRSISIDKVVNSLQEYSSLSSIKPLEKEDDLIAIWVKKNGIYLVSHDLYPVLIDQSFFCVGGCDQFMWGALYAGATAVQAVELAIKYTDCAGGRVQSESIEM